MAGLLDRQSVVGLLGPTLDPTADPDEFRRALHDMIALRPHLAEMPHHEGMPPYQIVEDANGVRHLVRAEPFDGPPPGAAAMIDAGVPSRVAGLPMRGDSDAPPNAVRPRRLHLAHAASASQERAQPAPAPGSNPPAAVSDNDLDKSSRAQPPQVPAEAAASPGPSAAPPAPANASDLAASVKDTATDAARGVGAIAGGGLGSLALLPRLPTFQQAVLQGIMARQGVLPERLKSRGLFDPSPPSAD